MTERRHVGRSRMRERGAAAVEFAIILPLLVLMVGGIVDWGRFMYTQAMLTNAAREAARALSLGYPVGAVGTAGSAVDRFNNSAIGLPAPNSTDYDLFFCTSGPCSAASLTLAGSVACTSTSTVGASAYVTARYKSYKWIFLQPLLGNTKPNAKAVAGCTGT